MRRKWLDTELAQTIAWIWLGIVIAGLAAWLVYKYWRKRHPPASPVPERSYSQRLQTRLNKGQNAAIRKRRSRSVTSGPRRP